MIGVVFADLTRSIEDTSAGFLDHNTLFQALPADVPCPGTLLVVRNDSASVGHYVAELLAE